jgi:hypothetical protein
MKLSKETKQSMLNVVTDCDSIVLASYEYDVIEKALDDIDKDSFLSFFFSSNFREEWLKNLGIDVYCKKSRPCWYASSTYDGFSLPISEDEEELLKLITRLRNE